MVRANMVVGGIAAVFVAVILAAIVFVTRPGLGGDGGADIGPPGAGQPPVNGQIEVLGASSGEQRPGGGGAAAVASRPARIIVTASGAGVGSAPAARFGVPAPTGASAARCTPSLLQTVLGLVSTLLGGRPAC